MLSIIIPVYNVEAYIGRCLQSLVDTEIEDIEYIFVDDCTPDNSMSIIDNWEGRLGSHGQVTVHRFEWNRGISAVRNKGLELAHGEFVFFCDSDDYVEPQNFRELYNLVVNEKADIGWGNWFLQTERSQRYMCQPTYQTPQEAIRAMLDGSMRYNLWNKIIRRSLFTDSGFLFEEGRNMGEDMLMLPLFAHARKLVSIDKPVYHYFSQNVLSQTKVYSDKQISDLKHNVDRTIGLLKGSLTIGEEYYSFFMLNAKLPFLISNQWTSYRQWQQLFPEANTYILRNRRQSIRTRLLQYMAYGKQYWLVWLYNIIIYRIVL